MENDIVRKYNLRVNFSKFTFNKYIHIYIYVCMCVCVCVKILKFGEKLCPNFDWVLFFMLTESI